LLEFLCNFFDSAQYEHNCYKKGKRNIKDENGTWQSIDVYEYEDKLAYGHGENPCILLQGL